MNGKSSAFDPTALTQLKSILQDNFPPVLHSFCTNTENYISAIGQALHDKRISDAQSIAHKLASSAAQFGLLNLSQCTKQLELSSGDNADKLDLLYMQIHTAGQQALRYLNNSQSTDH